MPIFLNLQAEMEEQERMAAAEALEDNDEDTNDATDGKNSKGKFPKKNQMKKKSKAQRKNTTKRPAANGGDLNQKIFATMEKHKEVFFTIRLHSAQSAASLPPIQDPDPLMPVRNCCRFPRQF